jgi:hypothetical protein
MPVLVLALVVACAPDPTDGVRSPAVRASGAVPNLSPATLEPGDATLKIVGEAPHDLLSCGGVFEDGRLLVSYGAGPALAVVSTSGPTGTVTLSAVTTAGPPTVVGVKGYARVAGDVSGDGLADVLVAEAAEPDYALAVLGHAGEARILGASHEAAPLGDVTADGVDDLLIDQVYLLAGPLTADVAVADAAVSELALAHSVPDGQPRRADTNGDGVTDLIAMVGDPGTYQTSMVAHYEIPSGAVPAHESDVYLGDLGAIRSFTTWDFDADGYDDLLVQTDGVFEASPDGAYGNPAYLVRGPLPSQAWLGEAAETVFFASEELAGDGVAAGDLDGDGSGDALFYAGERTTHFAGVVRVFMAPGAGVYFSDDADAELLGTHPSADAAGIPDQLGALLQVADIDGDGKSDVMATAWGDDEGDADAGAIYVFAGGTFAR